MMTTANERCCEECDRKDARIAELEIEVESLKGAENTLREARELFDKREAGKLELQRLQDEVERLQDEVERLLAKVEARMPADDPYGLFSGEEEQAD